MPPWIKAVSYYNRLDYGYALGIEIHPVMGLLIGARYNISLANLYKQPTPSSYISSGGAPAFLHSQYQAASI